MRSSKSRSRSKSNRNNRSVGNIVNRVFDSSGPEGKVRGTPQQIIDKYNQLARDAQLSNDRVAAENFQQHAEHYLRMLGEAQREIDSRREQQEREMRERQAEKDRERAERQQERDASKSADEDNGAEAEETSVQVSDAADSNNDDDSGLVETPESRSGDSQPSEAPEQPAAAAAPKPKRAPRKPRTEKAADGNSEGGDKPKPKRTSTRKPRAKKGGDGGAATTQAETAPAPAGNEAAE